MTALLIDKDDCSVDEKTALKDLLVLCSEELYGKGSCDVKLFLSSHYLVYLIVDGYNVVGFTSYTVNDSFGMNEPAVLNDYLYILPTYRNTDALYVALIQTGNVIEHTNLPLEHCYASTGSEKLSRKLDGKKLYTAYRYDRKEVLREYSRLKRIIERKTK